MNNSGIYEDEVGNIYLKFGGKIGVTVCNYGQPEIHCFGIEFKHLKDEHEIGEELSINDNTSDENCLNVNLIFDKVKSIDLLIDYLNKVKTELINSFNKGE